MKLNHWNKTLLAGICLALVSASASALEFQVKKPARATAKPDLVVYMVNQNYYAGGDVIRVTIRNNGNATSGSAVLSAQNMQPGGGYGEASIPSVEPGKIKNVDIKLNKPPKKGDRLKFFADAKQHVVESNENNNIKYINY